jgi:hypothetical protein
MEQQNGFIVPDDILEEADAATFNLLSAKSKERYLNVLEKFRDWMRTKNVDVITEEVGASRVMAVRGKSRSPEYLQFYNRFLHFFLNGCVRNEEMTISDW